MDRDSCRKTELEGGGKTKCQAPVWDGHNKRALFTYDNHASAKFCLLTTYMWRWRLSAHPQQLCHKWETPTPDTPCARSNWKAAKRRLHHLKPPESTKEGCQMGRCWLLLSKGMAELAFPSKRGSFVGDLWPETWSPVALWTLCQLASPQNREVRGNRHSCPLRLGSVQTPSTRLLSCSHWNQWKPINNLDLLFWVISTPDEHPWTALCTCVSSLSQNRCFREGITLHKRKIGISIGTACSISRKMRFIPFPLLSCHPTSWSHLH